MGTYALGSDFGLQTLYEPEAQLNLETGKNVHRVALSAQWKLDNGDILSGNKFLDWADQQGVSKGITDQLLNQALQHWHIWASQGLSPELIIRIGSSMLHDLKTTEVLTNIVEQHNVPKGKVVIETSEASVFDSIDNAIDVLSRLRIKGFKIAIAIESDSESVLSMVDKLPMDEIVIDMYPLLSKSNFREDMEVEFTYSSLTSMTRQKDIVCTARNIEREDLLAFVIQCKFQGARGSVISEPISAKAVEPFFRAES